MSSSIREFWQGLKSVEHPVLHPGDEQVFKDHPHTFNLDFPPPAFIGKVDTAPIVILMAHGGYDCKMTPFEFPERADRVEYLQWLNCESVDIPRNLSPYYTKNPLFDDWIRDGKAVIVNAVAYRTAKIREGTENDKVAKLLPSWKVHREWFCKEVLPDAERGQRRVVAHHPRLWGLREGRDWPGIIDYPPSHLKRLPCALKEELDTWLAEKRKR